MFGQKQRKEPPPLPPPPASFPDGTPFPGEKHLKTIERIARTMYALGTVKDRDAVTFVIAYGTNIIRNPNAVTASVFVNSTIVGNIQGTTEWLHEHGLETEMQEWLEIQRDVWVFWDSPGGCVHEIKKNPVPPEVAYPPS